MEEPVVVVEDRGRREELQVVLVQGAAWTQEPPMVVWCGGYDKGQDITVRLVRLVPSQEDEHPSGAETLSLLKVHSAQLRKCSKYFETCLSERWRDPGAASSSSGEFELSLEANANVACYQDCFSRMYSPFRKDFRDVAYCLELLKVASQIEYCELMEYVSLYLSTIRWSDEDERRIREYSSSPDFSRNHAPDLVTRLGLDVSGEEHMKKVSEHTRQLTFWGVTNALEAGDHLNFRKFVEELLEGNLFCTVTKIIILVAKNKLVQLENKFQESVRFTLEHQVSAMCWILRVLLNVGVAEELVECLLSSKLMPVYLTVEEDHRVERAGREMAEVILKIYQEVVAGRLLLRTAERVALIEIWHDLLRSYLKKEDYHEASKELFLTLPLEDQFELFETQEEYYIDFIDGRSLATLVKKNCTAMEGNGWPVFEGNPMQEQSSSDRGGDEDGRPPKRRKPKRTRWGP